MQIVHVLNSGVISGPEMLVVPALKKLSSLREVWSLEELRQDKGSGKLARFCEQIGIPVVAVPVASRLDIRAVLHLRRLINGLPRNTIIHSHDAKASVYVWLARLFLFKRSTLLFATHHGALVRDNFISRIYEMIFVRIAGLFFNRVLCVSESEFRLLMERGVSLKILRCHRNGVSRPALQWHERRAKPEDEVSRIAILARLSPEKNIIRALRTLAVMDQKFCRKWSLDILGEGREKERLFASAIELGIGDKVHLRGFVPEAWRELDNYHCLLSFSLGEGLPVSLLEAGWRQTPVFASAVGGVPEVCGDGAGVLFSLNDSDEVIAHRLADYLRCPQQLRSTASQLQRRVFDCFSQERWLDELMTHYASVSAD
ncbi:MAG: hypothetical protein RI932_1450 [Pseudomonadota bacterium]|jgi:glycosyltransferase involved in cell wall biosynthesis